MSHSQDGIQIWKTKASQGGICATGCLHQQSTSVLFGTLDGSCLALHQSSGRIIWKRKLQNPVFVAPVVLRTGYALFCSVAGTLCCFDIETDCQVNIYLPFVVRRVLLTFIIADMAVYDIWQCIFVPCDMDSRLYE